MPNYNTPPLNACYPGDQVFLFNAEQPAPPQASKQIAMAMPYDGVAPFVALEFQFSADPGAFLIQIQTADTDTDTAYITLPAAGSLSTVNANFFARVELNPFLGKFLRVLLSTRTNAVNLTVKATR